MRKLTANMEVSLNGIVENPHLWPDHKSPDYQQDLTPSFEGTGALLFGRVTYEMMASFWPHQDNAIGHFMNRSQKYVVSSTLKNPDWDNTTVVDSAPLEYIRQLKQTGKDDLVLLGSLTLLDGLLKAELVDQLQLSVHPLMVGEGRAFPQVKQLDAFQLQSHKAYAGGMARVTLAQ